MENSEKYIGFSFFEKILGVGNIDREVKSCYSEYKKNDTEFCHYFMYSDINILTSALSNCVFLLKNFEKDFFKLNGQTVLQILGHIDIEELKLSLIAKPNSEHMRKIAFLIEAYLGVDIDFGEKLEIKKQYINILNNDIFITNEQKTIVNKKYKIIDNSLGEIGKFNPILIKEKLNENIFTADFNKNLENINNKFDSEIIEKAVNYLYTKETKGSLEIEGEKFHQSKNRGFLKLISDIPLGADLDKEAIIKYYNIIYSDSAIYYRKTQNYIGSGNGMMGENIIEYITPKAEDLEELMNSLFAFYDKNKQTLNPILLSSILSTQFVLIHPFLDGNGRTSRFLLQYSLLNSGIGHIKDQKIVLPVSAYIMLNKKEYYKRLEKISGDLIDYIKFEEKDNQDIEVLNKTIDVYRNLNFTNISNYFYEVIDNSINIDYQKELTYINDFNNLYTKIDENFNISSNNISFIVKNLLENNGKLSKNKLKTLEKKGLTIELINKIEHHIQ